MGYYSAKVCVLGPSGVGKTCITVRFVEGSFDEGETSTIGASFLQKSVVNDKETRYKLQIWDTAGQERYKNYD